MNETKVQIGEDVLLDIGIHSEWYISSIGYDGKSVGVTLCRKADRNKEWWLGNTSQTEKNCDNCGTKTEACYFCNPMRNMWTPQADLLVTEYPQDGEVNLIGRDKTEAVVMAYDVYKELIESQKDIHDLTDCDFCKERNCKDCEGGKDEPQTDCPKTCPSIDICTKDDTDCAWKKG